MAYDHEYVAQLIGHLRGSTGSQHEFYGRLIAEHAQLFGVPSSLSVKVCRKAINFCTPAFHLGQQVEIFGLYAPTQGRVIGAIFDSESEPPDLSWNYVVLSGKVWIYCGESQLKPVTASNTLTEDQWQVVNGFISRFTENHPSPPVPVRDFPLLVAD